jgi:hypothetical protein
VRVASDGFGAPCGGTMGGRLERIGFKGGSGSWLTRPYRLARYG